MPEANYLVEGVIELRGAYIPLIDLPTWINSPMTPEEKEKSVIIVADFDDDEICLLNVSSDFSFGMIT